MKTYFTSDTHFGHAGMMSPRMGRPRPFASVEAMDEYLIAAWNNRVRPGDEIWHLGDFAYGASAAHCRSVFSRLNGRKRLILGNHDRARTTDLPWYSQDKRAEVVVEGRRFVLGHYAQRTWNRSHHGSLHLYGHSHGALPGCGRSLDVGVDVWHWRPITVSEILERMAEDAAQIGGPWRRPHSPRRPDMRGSYTYSEPMPRSVCCLNCGRVSMGLTRAETEAAVASANAQIRPGERPIGIDYFRCCPHPRYRPAVLGDVPDGATISGVMAEGYMDGGPPQI